MKIFNCTSIVTFTKIAGIVLMLLVSFNAFSQQFLDKFIYGKMIKGRDTLIGYFRFSGVINEKGQSVDYKKDARTLDPETFQSKEYDSFESDSLCLETFKAVSTRRGYVEIMIPRIINGKIQLFAAVYGEPGYFGLGLSTKETYCIKKGTQKFRVNKINFKDQMWSILKDDPELISRIDNGELHFKDMIEIVDAYNHYTPEPNPAQ